MNIKEFISKIIPPNDYGHRNGFNNTQFIDELNEHEKIQVENELILHLQTNPEDMLIVETLGYLKSKNSLPLLKELLVSTKYEMSKLIIACSIYDINYDNSMLEVAVKSFKNLPNIYYLPTAFFCLKKFKDPEVNKLIKSYITDKNDFVSNSAKRALGIHDSMN